LQRFFALLEQVDQAQTPVTPQVSPNDNSKYGKRLTQQQIGLILQLANAGRNQPQIAEQLGIDDSTVSRTLANFSDGRELARKRLEGGALRLAETVIRTKDAATALKALGKLDVVREDQASTGNQMMVMLGNAELPLSPPSIDVFALSPASEIALSDATGEAKGPPIMGVSPDSVA
jgi:DNA-binding MarR family transcriptional regulator